MCKVRFQISKDAMTMLSVAGYVGPVRDGRDNRPDARDAVGGLVNCTWDQGLLAQGYAAATITTSLGGAERLAEWFAAIQEKLESGDLTTRGETYLRDVKAARARIRRALGINDGRRA